MLFIFNLLSTLGCPLWSGRVLQRQGQRPHLLTFPLVQLQVRVVQRLIIRQRFCLLVNVPELGEEIEIESLGGADPLLWVQEQHLFQDTHGCGGHTHTHTHARAGQWEGNRSTTGSAPGSQRTV